MTQKNPIKNSQIFDQNTDDQKKDSFAADDIEKLVGIKISAGVLNKSQKESQEKTEKNDKTDNDRPATTYKHIGAQYTFEDFSHLIKPKSDQKLVFNNGLEFLYALNKAKHEFNLNHQSEFLNHYYKRHNEYRSRRDELGGYISPNDWKAFIDRLEQIIKITARRKKTEN